MESQCIASQSATAFSECLLGYFLFGIEAPRTAETEQVDNPECKRRVHAEPTGMACTFIRFSYISNNLHLDQVHDMGAETILTSST